MYPIQHPALRKISALSASLHVLQRITTRLQRYGIGLVNEPDLAAEIRETQKALDYERGWLLHQAGLKIGVI